MPLTDRAPDTAAGAVLDVPGGRGGALAAPLARVRSAGRRTTARNGLRLRLTTLSTALLALVGALLLALAYLLVGRVVAALPHFPAGTPVRVNGVTVDAAVESARVVRQGRETVLVVGLIAFPLVVIAGGLLSWVLIGRTLRPLSTLTSAARALSESSLDQRIALTGPRDEVAELADTFDDMLGRLQAAFEAERRFVANASHELRTPLSVIRTEVDVTLADPSTDEADLRRMGEVAREATDRADRLLNSLLFLARTQASGLAVVQPVDLAALVRPALTAVQGELTARQLTVSVTGGPAVVGGDPALLERVIGNLGGERGAAQRVRRRSRGRHRGGGWSASVCWCCWCCWCCWWCWCCWRCWRRRRCWCWCWPWSVRRRCWRRRRWFGCRRRFGWPEVGRCGVGRFGVGRFRVGRRFGREWFWAAVSRPRVRRGRLRRDRHCCRHRGAAVRAVPAGRAGQDGPSGQRARLVHRERRRRGSRRDRVRIAGGWRRAAGAGGDPGLSSGVVLISSDDRDGWVSRARPAPRARHG